MGDWPRKVRSLATLASSACARGRYALLYLRRLVCKILKAQRRRANCLPPRRLSRNPSNNTMPATLMNWSSSKMRTALPSARDNRRIQREPQGLPCCDSDAHLVYILIYIFVSKLKPPRRSFLHTSRNRGSFEKPQTNEILRKNRKRGELRV